MRAPKTFEDGMARLDTILTQMQSEDTTLAESVKLYAEAASLMEYCRATLEKASLQIDEIDAKRSAAKPAASSIMNILPGSTVHWKPPAIPTCRRNPRSAARPATA